MDVREKLVELIESARYWGSNTSEEIADNLLDSGVMVPEWISVYDELPEVGGYVVCIAKRNAKWVERDGSRCQRGRTNDIHSSILLGFCSVINSRNCKGDG